MGVDWMRRHRYPVVAVVCLLGYFAVPDGWWRTGWQAGVGYLAAAAILVGVRRHRPAGAAAWYWFAAGVFGNASGIVVEAVDAAVLANPPYPSVADVGYLSLYPCVAVGLALLIRRRTVRRDWTTLVDVTTVTTGLGLLAWVFTIHPLAWDRSIGLLGHAVSIAYPVGDVVLVAMTVRLRLDARGASPAYRLLTAALLAFLAGDAAWAVVNQLVWELSPLADRLLSTVFLAGYLLFGAAVLQPSVRELGRPEPAAGPRLGRGLLLLLTAASLVAPAVLAFQLARDQLTDGMAIVICSAVLFLLVVTRMAQLLRQLEEQTRKVRELSRMDELTGLPNRRAWTTELPRAIERARRDGVPLSIAMLDLDRFKAFNDSYGHPAGDRLLKTAAAAWQDELRTVDHLARYGGEEFIVLLPGSAGPAVLAVLARLRAATPLGQTCSVGVATWDGTETSDELVARADRALYAAKRAGRDRIMEDMPLAGDRA